MLGKKVNAKYYFNVVHDNQMSETIFIFYLVPWRSYQDRYKSAAIMRPPRLNLKNKT